VFMACMNSSQHSQTNHVFVARVCVCAGRLLAEAALWPGCQQRGRGEYDQRRSRAGKAGKAKRTPLRGVVAVLWVVCCGPCERRVREGLLSHKNVLGEEGVGMHARDRGQAEGERGFLAWQGTLVGMRELPWGGVLDLWADTAGWLTEHWARSLCPGSGDVSQKSVRFLFLFGALGTSPVSPNFTRDRTLCVSHTHTQSNPTL
jgi:hypothetical protein